MPPCLAFFFRGCEGAALAGRLFVAIIDGGGGWSVVELLLRAVSGGGCCCGGGGAEEEAASFSELERESVAAADALFGRPLRKEREDEEPPVREFDRESPGSGAVTRAFDGARAAGRRRSAATAAIIARSRAPLSSSSSPSPDPS